MADFTTPASNAGSVQGQRLSGQTGGCPRSRGAGRLAVLRPADRNIRGRLCHRAGLRLAARQFRKAGSNRRSMLAGILVLAGLVPAIEEFNAASLAFIVLALGVGLSADDQSRTGQRWRTGRRALRPLSDRPIQISQGRRRRVQSAGADDRLHRVVHSRGSRQHLRISVRVGKSAAREMDQPDESGRRRILYQLRAGAVLGRGLVDRLALHPCLVARAGPRPTPIWPRPSLQEQADAGHRRRLLRRRDHPAFADPVQSAVCGSDRPRRGLSLGQCDAAGRHQLCGLCASRRLSPHPHGAAGRWIRSGCHEARAARPSDRR